MWDFETEPEYQEQLDWVDTFVRTEVEPLDLVLGDPYDKADEQARRVVRPLQQQVRDRGLWAAHLEPELGGQGYGQVRLALLNELLGRSRWAPSVFGCQAPDSGNAEILARFGTSEQRDRYLQPLLDGEMSSCYSMTEPLAGADPTLFTTRAVRDGDSWVIEGEKWFSSNARHAAFLIVMVVTNPEVDPHHGMSMFIVPSCTPGLEIIRDAGIGTESPEHSSHATCGTPGCGSPPITCSARRARHSRSPRPGSAEAGSTTGCARSRRCAGHSTSCSNERCPAGPAPGGSPTCSPHRTRSPRAGSTSSSSGCSCSARHG
jgi:acyl-CoA dehydrogenase